MNLLQNRILNITEEFRRGTFTQRCSQLSFGILCLFLLECSITGGGRYWEVGPVSIRILLGAWPLFWPCRSFSGIWAHT